MKEIDLQQPPKPKSKRKVDIVFCIDFSGSMTPIIEGLKMFTADFIKGLFYDPDQYIDLRMGFVGHYYGNFYIKDFTTSPDDFAEALFVPTTFGNEYTLPALDWSVDFPWRDDAHRIVILFTDECLDTGAFPEEQRSKKEELARKIAKKKVKVLYYGVECPEYKEFFTSLPNGYYETVDFSNLKNEDLREFFNIIGRTASRISSGNAQLPEEYQQDLYNIKEKIKQEGFKVIKL